MVLLQMLQAAGAGQLLAKYPVFSSLKDIIEWQAFATAPLPINNDQAANSEV